MFPGRRSHVPAVHGEYVFDRTNLACDDCGSRKSLKYALRPSFLAGGRDCLRLCEQCFDSQDANPEMWRMPRHLDFLAETLRKLAASGDDVAKLAILSEVHEQGYMTGHADDNRITAALLAKRDQEIQELQSRLHEGAQSSSSTAPVPGAKARASLKRPAGNRG